MHRFRVVSACVLLSATVIVSGPVRAMETRQFDKMADQDQSEYIGGLITGAEKVLTDSGKSDLVAQVKHLFTTKMVGDSDVIGMVEFERNLALARVEDMQNVAKTPNAQRIEIEDALAVTLEKNGNKLPDGFYTIASNFRPKLPPKKQ
jgi:hypothetical protein